MFKRILVLALLITFMVPQCFAGFTSKISIRFSGTYTNSLDNQTVSAPWNYTKTWSFTSGTGANQAQVVWSDQRTLSASATEELDLAGSLTDAFGDTITFTSIKAVYIYAASGNTNDVVVGGDAVAALVNWVSDSSDEIILLPDGAALLVAPDATGYAVTAGTGDILEVTNSAGSTSVTYDIIIIGEGTTA